jgi:hypothetical protein
LLIVGGNDTPRNSMSGGLLFLSQNLNEFAKLRAKPELVESMVPEIIRYQTPIAYIRRTALANVEFGGLVIRKGDKVAMWYISGNRDEEAIEEPDRFIIDRSRPRQHPVSPAFFNEGDENLDLRSKLRPERTKSARRIANLWPSGLTEEGDASRALTVSLDTAVRFLTHMRTDAGLNRRISL